MFVLLIRITERILYKSKKTSVVTDLCRSIAGAEHVIVAPDVEQISRRSANRGLLAEF